MLDWRDDFHYTANDLRGRREERCFLFLFDDVYEVHWALARGCHQTSFWIVDPEGRVANVSQYISEWCSWSPEHFSAWRRLGFLRPKDIMEDSMRFFPDDFFLLEDLTRRFDIAPTDYDAIRLAIAMS